MEIESHGESIVALAIEVSSLGVKPNLDITDVLQVVLCEEV